MRIQKLRELSRATKVSVALNVALASVAGVASHKLLSPPTLIQASQFAMLYNAADALVETGSDPFVWEMYGTVEVSAGVERVARLAARLDPVDPSAPWASKLGPSLLLYAGPESFGSRPVADETAPDLTALADDAAPEDWGEGWRIGTSSTDQGGVPHIEHDAAGQGYIAAHVDEGSQDWQDSFDWEFTANRRLYATWVQLFQPEDGTGCGASGAQRKIWRANTSAFNESGGNQRGEMMGWGNAMSASGWHPTNWNAAVWPMSPGSYPARCVAYDPQGGGAACDVENLQAPANDLNRWARYEVEVQQSTMDAYDGFLRIRVWVPEDDELEAEYWEGGFEGVLGYMSGVDYSMLESPGNFTRFVLQNYWSGSQTDCYPAADWAFADVQIQTGSFARIEIGDSPVYASCTMRWAAAVESWEDDLIQVRGWYGELPDPWYVYVVKDDGSVVGGIPEP